MLFCDCELSEGEWQAFQLAGSLARIFGPELSRDRMLAACYPNVAPIYTL